MKSKTTLLLALLLALSLVLTACGDDPNSTNPPPTVNQWDVANLQLGTIPQDDGFALTNENVRFFTLTDTGDIIAATEERQLARYSRKGELLEEYDNPGQLTNLTYQNGLIYAFDMDQKRLISYNLEKNEKNIVSDVFDIDIIEFNDMHVVGDTIVAFLIPGIPHDHDDDEDEADSFGTSYENGYMDFNEKLYRIDLNNGTVVDTKIDNIIAVYQNSAGEIYYYACKDESYGLYHLDIESNRSSKVADMDDVGYLHTFLYEGDQFLYTDAGFRLQAKHMTKETILNIIPNFNVGLGSHFHLFAGHLIYRKITDFGTPDNPAQTAEITDEYIGYLFDGDQKIGMEGEPSDIKDYSNTTLTISASSNHYVVMDTQYLKNETGIKAVVAEQNYDPLAITTELMAGNEDIDIYVFSAGTYILMRLKEMGAYVPLNGSEIIEDYIDGCFDYIADYSTKDGDIWGLPLSTNGAATIYVPENFEHYGLTFEDVEYFNDYMATLEKYQDTGDDCYVLGNSAGWLYSSLHRQYEFTYNDYENKMVNFQTELYKSMFETLLSGWEELKGSSHPLFRGFFDINSDELSFQGADNLMVYKPKLPEYVIFKYESISNSFEKFDKEQKNRLEWRAFPPPRLSEDVKYNAIDIRYAIVNPHSQNKEAALAYLEAVANQPHMSIQNGFYNFTQKDIQSYMDLYDTNIPLVEDILSIMDNGIIDTNPAPNMSNQYQFDYQSGLITADEAIAYLQREIEMALNE